MPTTWWMIENGDNEIIYKMATSDNFLLPTYTLLGGWWLFDCNDTSHWWDHFRDRLLLFLRYKVGHSKKTLRHEISSSVLKVRQNTAYWSKPIPKYVCNNWHIILQQRLPYACNWAPNHRDRKHCFLVVTVIIKLIQEWLHTCLDDLITTITMWQMFRWQFCFGYVTF